MAGNHQSYSGQLLSRNLSEMEQTRSNNEGSKRRRLAERWLKRVEETSSRKLSTCPDRGSGRTKLSPKWKKGKADKSGGRLILNRYQVPGGFRCLRRDTFPRSSFDEVQKRRGRNPETHCDGLRYAILSHREISTLGWYRCGYGLFRDVFSEQITFCFGNLTVPLTWPRVFVSIAGGYLSRLIGSTSKGGWKKIFVRFCLRIFLESKIFEVGEICTDLWKRTIFLFDLDLT